MYKFYKSKWNEKMTMWLATRMEYGTNGYSQLSYDILPFTRKWENWVHFQSQQTSMKTSAVIATNHIASKSEECYFHKKKKKKKPGKVNAVT
jgi:hypothetical protein